jgi:hypothetical protein
VSIKEWGASDTAPAEKGHYTVTPAHSTGIYNSIRIYPYVDETIENLTQSLDEEL